VLNAKKGETPNMIKVSTKLMHIPVTILKVVSIKSLFLVIFTSLHCLAV
jgi:hypothetical protein